MSAILLYKKVGIIDIPFHSIICTAGNYKPKILDALPKYQEDLFVVAGAQIGNNTSNILMFYHTRLRDFLEYEISILIGSGLVQLHMAISPLSFNIFIHALQVSSSSADFDCNRNVLSTVFLSSCNLVYLLKYRESNITWQT